MEVHVVHQPIQFGEQLRRRRLAAGITLTSILGIFRSVFEQYRKLGQTIEPGLLLPALIAQTS